VNYVYKFYVQLLKASFEKGLPESSITKEHVDAQGAGLKAEIPSHLLKHLRITKSVS